MLTGQIAILLVYTRPIVYINEEIKMAQTLEELKAENAAKEAEALENTETQEVETTEAEVEEETQETQEVAEQNEEEGEAETIEAWMQTEEQTSDGNEKECHYFPGFVFVLTTVRDPWPRIILTFFPCNSMYFPTTKYTTLGPKFDVHNEMVITQRRKHLQS